MTNTKQLKTYKQVAKTLSQALQSVEFKFTEYGIYAYIHCPICNSSFEEHDHNAEAYHYLPNKLDMSFNALKTLKDHIAIHHASW